jgi:anti-sigma-K factor RskA
VSSASEHQDWTDDLSAYALGALSEADSARVEQHVSECESCQAELDWMHAAVDALPASVPQVEPPPELHTRLMQIVGAEAELLRAAGKGADQPSRRTRRSWAGWRLGGAVAAACAVAAAAVVIATEGGAATRTIEARLNAVLRGHATASLRVTGVHAQLVVAGLPAPPANHVDELWVRRPGSRPRPAGTFVVRTGTIALTAPVARGDIVMATVEPGAGDSAPTTVPFLVAAT